MTQDTAFGGAATIGARLRQEDAWATQVLRPDEHGARLLAVVADGMGGHPAGDEASRIACRAFVEICTAAAGSPRERLRHALDAANRQVRAAVLVRPELFDMGTTLVAALFHSGGCDWLSVGDSFLFHYRGGRIGLINPLHTFGAELDEMARRGEITPAEAAEDPGRAIITSAIMGAPLDEVAEGSLCLAPDDLVILATDGVETLGEDGIASVGDGRAGKDAGRIAGAIIGRIEELGHPYQDNATVVVVRASTA